MDLNYGAEYEDFREEVRTFLATNWKPGINEEAPTTERIKEFRLKASRH